MGHGGQQSQPRSGAPLSRALLEWVGEAWPQLDARRREVLLWRMGWLGDRRPTLEEAGRELGITREGMRQLTVKLEARLRRIPSPFTDALDAAVAVIGSSSEEAWIGAGEALWAAGLTDSALPEEGVELLFDLIGRSEVLQAYWTRSSRDRVTRDAAIQVAKALTRSVGVACLDWVGADADADLGDRDLRKMLQREASCQFLDDSWFWSPATPPGRNRTENVTVKMLAACGPLSLGDIRAGLDRVRRFRPALMPHVPSVHALRLFYRAHPRFQVDERDEVSSLQPLDPLEVLDEIERKLYLILSEAPLGVLDRSELTRRGVAVGINQNSLTVATSYSPILDNPVQDCWTLRGREVSPAVLEAVRQPRKPRFHDEAWLPSGELRLRCEVGPYWGLVVSVPKAYARLFASQDFAAFDPTGKSIGQIRFNERGNSWGYSQYLQTEGAEEGDLLTVDFQLAERTARLSLERTSAVNPKEAGHR